MVRERPSRRDFIPMAVACQALWVRAAKEKSFLSKKPNRCTSASRHSRLEDAPGPTEEDAHPSAAAFAAASACSSGPWWKWRGRLRERVGTNAESADEVRSIVTLLLPAPPAPAAAAAAAMGSRYVTDQPTSAGTLLEVSVGRLSGRASTRALAQRGGARLVGECSSRVGGPERWWLHGANKMSERSQQPDARVPAISSRAPAPALALLATAAAPTTDGPRTDRARGRHGRQGTKGDTEARDFGTDACCCCGLHSVSTKVKSPSPTHE